MSFSTPAPVAARRARFAARNCSRAKPFGFTLVELLVVISIIGALMAMLLPAIQNAFETSRQNSCKTNINNLATAMYGYGIDFNVYPGYMNLLTTDSGKAYTDNQGNMIPVNWVVELLPRLDRKQQYDNMTKDVGDTGQQGGSQNTTNTQTLGKFEQKQYVEVFVCPSNARQKTGAPMSYVANTGQQDLPMAQQGNSGGGAGGGATTGGTSSSAGFKRDHEANGMFHDNYSEDPLVKPNGNPLLMVKMRPTMLSDPQNMTIMLTENVDCPTYIFDSTSAGGMSANQPFPYAEVLWGCVYAPGVSTQPGGGQQQQQQGATGISTTVVPIMNPQDGLDAHRPNIDIGKGDGIKYEYCRPSSKHPQLFVCAFAAKNVEMVKDNISYFVFCKLMSTDDMNMKIPGSNTPCDQMLREFPITEANIKQ